MTMLLYTCKYKTIINSYVSSMLSASANMSRSVTDGRTKFLTQRSSPQQAYLESVSPVGWGGGICQLHFFRWLELPKSILDMMLNNLMVRLQFWSFGKSGVHITSKSTVTLSFSTCEGPIYGQIELSNFLLCANNKQEFLKLCANK